jgi:hypothetical protein
MELKSFVNNKQSLVPLMLLQNLRFFTRGKRIEKFMQSLNEILSSR